MRKSNIINSYSYTLGLNWDGSGYQQSDYSNGNCASNNIYDLYYANSTTPYIGMTFYRYSNLTSPLDWAFIYYNQSTNQLFTINDQGVVTSISNCTPPSVDFEPLNQTLRNWTGITCTPSGDVYACIDQADFGTSGMYKQTGGIGNFLALSQPGGNNSRWNEMASAPNGDVYAVSTFNSNILKQTGGTGNFVYIYPGVRQWMGVTVAPNGDVYACVYNGDIYKQTGGTGSWVALNQTSRQWSTMGASPNGDIYAGAGYFGIFKQTGGTGNFVLISGTNGFALWVGITVAPNGDVYACSANPGGGNIYKQTGGTGSFVSLNQSSLNWSGISADINGDVYACVDDYTSTGDIYKKVNS
jgi:hypothetical protein